MMTLPGETFTRQVRLLLANLQDDYRQPTNEGPVEDSG